NSDYDLVLIITDENLKEKSVCIRQAEKHISSNTIIAVNTESFPLEVIQESSNFPERIIGVNWSEPAHTTKFMELIVNGKTDERQVDRLFYIAKKEWQKDPYVVSGGKG